MTDEQHLLVLLGEEAAEVTQQASRAIRFGMDNMKPGWQASNRDLIQAELNDLFTVASMLGFKPRYSYEKRAKVEMNIVLSQQLGQL